MSSIPSPASPTAAIRATWRRRLKRYLKSTGIADISYWGPEAEFYIFNNVRYDQTAHSGYYYVDSDEGIWNTGREEGPNLGYKLRHKEGYFPVPPSDTLQDIRSEIILALQGHGRARRSAPPRSGHRRPERNRHALRPAGEDGRQSDELQVRHPHDRQEARHDAPPSCPSRSSATTARACTSTRASGRATPTSSTIAKGYALLSETAKYYIGGLLKHAPALLAIAAPTTNSYRRLVPGFEAPVNLAYSQRNRSAACRIPVYSTSPKAKRIEFRCPDPSSNPYTCASPPCSWPAWTASRTRSIPASRWTRTSTSSSRRRRQDQEHARLPGRGSRCPGKGSRIPARRRRLHPGPDRNLDHLQAREGAGSRQPPPRAVRILPLLRPIKRRFHSFWKRIERQAQAGLPLPFWPHRLFWYVP